MSALLLRRRRRHERWDPCDNGCVDYETKGARKPVSHRGRSTATWEAYLMGRHCAWLCDKCKEAWRSWWPGAGGGVPVVDGRRGARQEQEAA